MNPSIKKPEEKNEYFFKEGCHILEVSNSEDFPEVSIARARVEKGAVTRWHSLTKTVERYVILEGEGRVELGEYVCEIVSAGDVVIIPAACKQRIANIGKSDLIFLAICAPRFQAENYVDEEAIDEETDTD